MKHLFYFSFLLALTFSACQKEEALVPTLPYVNLKYPQVGQKSLYTYYEKTNEDGFCAPNYSGDTMIVEIFEPTQNGFHIRRYLSEGSDSQTNEEGVFFENKMDTIYTELVYTPDTIFINNPENYLDLIFIFDKYPIMQNDGLLEEYDPCTPILFGATGVELGAFANLQLEHFTMGNQVYNNISILGYANYYLNTLVIREAAISSYHQVFRSFYLENWLPAYSGSGFELIIE